MKIPKTTKEQPYIRFVFNRECKIQLSKNIYILSSYTLGLLVFIFVFKRYTRK